MSHQSEQARSSSVVYIIETLRTNYRGTGVRWTYKHDGNTYTLP